jgi:SAM-dependent methyltransferase
VSTVIWHDLECGTYTVDLPLWRELADRQGGTVLDVGCGTGRVALDLAAHGHRVIGIDVDEDLVHELGRRAEGLAVQAVKADARNFVLAEHVGLVVVPMQSVQLFGGIDGRRRFLDCASRALAPGGLLAIAICDVTEATFSEADMLPMPDMRELDGRLYSSRPLAIVDEGPVAAIHRLREVVDRSGTRSESSDVIRLERLDSATLEREGAAAGFAVLPRRHVPSTRDYIGSEVVMLGG